MTEVMLAIRHGNPGPPVLQRFRLATELWRRLGMRLADLESLPWREADAIVTILELAVREEAAQNQQQGGPGGG